MYGIVSLALIRPLAVLIAMWGSRAPWQTSVFMGWFGPRGIASIIIAAVVVKDAGLELNSLAVLVTSVTVGLSVYLHGLTAEPGAKAYADWHAREHPDDHNAWGLLAVPDHPAPRRPQ